MGMLFLFLPDPSLASAVERERMTVHINILSQLEYIFDYCKTSGSEGCADLAQKCILVVARVAEDGMFCCVPV